MQYAKFAHVYDALMKDVPYEQWIGFILEKTAVPKGAEAFDAACGTGSALLELLKRGLKGTAMDISEDMLQIASERIQSAGKRARLVQGNIAHFSLHRPVSLITCVCDGVNYLINPQEAQSFFNCAYRFLKEGGALAFDVSGRYKLEKILPGNLYYEDDEDITYFWQSSYKDKLCSMELTFFVKQPNGLYERFDEIHTQRAYSLSEIKGMLEKSGFTRIESWDGYNNQPANENSGRMLFIAYK